eukprot:CAMPEP_0170190036 /NCGR_PEP_ID=MMETSP0040_2-20121228/48330_1 /TAXON_ID=641309 /ORGANISM="Lotharella oceanica, Strain CCMP622" /LENGTH=85 /DNA_ID=CAMNT_0010437773 /DNA_START=243 /DNA_END=500 /DNA_ORIENTATION=+
MRRKNLEPIDCVEMFPDPEESDDVEGFKKCEEENKSLLEPPSAATSRPPPVSPARPNPTPGTSRSCTARARRCEPLRAATPARPG